MGRNLGGGDVLSPSRRDSRRAAAGDLNCEAATVTIELHSEKVDSLSTDTTKVRKRALETSCTERRNQGLLQCGRHGIAVHDFWLMPWFSGGPHSGPSAATGCSASSRCTKAFRRLLTLNLHRDGRLSVDHLRDHQIATGFVGVLLDYAA